MKRLIPLITICLCMLASCSTMKQAGKQRHTTEVKQATVTVTADGMEPVSTRCKLQAVHDSVSVWSIRPLLNVEAGQMRADKEGVTLIDRIHRMYTTVRYKELPPLLRMVLKYKTIEDYTTGRKLGRGGQQQLTRSFKKDGQHISVTVDYGKIDRDNGMRLHEAKTQNYKQTDLQTLLRKLGIKL